MASRDLPFPWTAQFFMEEKEIYQECYQQKTKWFTKIELLFE